MIERFVKSPLTFQDQRPLGNFSLENKHTYRRILQVAGPIIIGQLAENVINLTDTIFVARLGEQQLGAVGLAGLYYYTFMLMGLGMAMGVQILVGRRNGEKSYHEIGVITDNALVTFAGIGFMIFALIKLVSPGLLALMIPSHDIYDMSRSYINTRSYSLLFVCLTFVFRAFYIGITETRVIIYITIGAALINVFFNQALIFGYWGFEKMGIRGSALASVIAEACALASYILYTVYRKQNKKFSLFKFNQLNFNIIWSFLKLGVPVMLQTWISVSSWFVFFIFMAHLNNRALSVSTLIKSVYILMMIPIWGFGSASNTLVSNAMGAERPFEVVPIVKRIILVSFTFLIPVVLFNFLFPWVILHIFSDDASVIADAVGPLRMVSVAILAYSFGGIMFNAVSGTGSTLVSLVIELVILFMYFAYVTFCRFLFPTSLTLFWGSELVYMGFMAILSFFYLRSGRWKGMKI